MSLVYNNTSARVFQPSLPLGVIVLAPFTATSAAGVGYNTLQDGTNNVLAQQSTVTGGIGLCTALVGTGVFTTTAATTGLVSYGESGTLSLTWVNAGANATLSAGTRLLLFQSQGN
jgi:hypothetical protein